jgi:hypothetical protein
MSPFFIFILLRAARHIAFTARAYAGLASFRAALPFLLHSIPEVS